MKDLDQILQEMDFQFLGSGKHSMSIDGMKKALFDAHFLFLDVRTDQEVKYLDFPFALHIPLNETAGPAG